MTERRFARLLIDTADALAAQTSGDDLWWAINTIARRLGANAVNAGAFERQTQSIDWVRSSMDPLWLEEYAEAELFKVDPLLNAAMIGRAPPVYDVAAKERLQRGPAKLRDLHGAMIGFEYNFMVTHSWFQGGAGMCLALSCGQDPDDMFGPGTARAFSAVSAMMSCRLVAPDGDLHEGWAYGADWQRLLPAERDVLAYLANGLTEVTISERLMVTEFEVSRLIRSASLKMKARSKEQALALAIARGQMEP